MKTRCQELLAVGNALFSKRFPLLTLWQTFAENFNPMRADFTRNRYISEEFASYLMTGRPVLAHRELSNALGAILRPPAMQWFKLRTGNESIDTDREASAWLDQAGATMRRVFNDRKSQFGRATKEGDADYVLTGQTVIEPSLNADNDGMLYRCWHLRDTVWTENAELVIDSVHRKWKLQARQLVAFGKKKKWNIHSAVTTKAEKDPTAEINCRVIVLPSDEYDSMGKETDAKGKSRLPFIRIVIDEDNQQIMEETPRRKLGYVIPRWITIGGFSQYAYSPSAVVALPDGRMMQQMTLTLLEIGAKILDPPMKAVGDAIQGGVNLAAGTINWVDPDYDERTGAVLEPMQFHPEGLQWGHEYDQKLEQVINEAFYLNVLNLPQYEGEKMTAYEVSQRMREYIRRASPLFQPMDTEYNGQICEDTFDTFLHMGAFGSILDMPKILRGQNVEFKFNNPLVQAEEEQKTQSFRAFSETLAVAMQTDPTARADADIIQAFRDAVPGTGAPPKWLVDRKAADKIRAQQAQQIQAQQTAEQLGGAGDAAASMGNAVKNVGDAATALQDAGAM